MKALHILILLKKQSTMHLIKFGKLVYADKNYQDSTRLRYITARMQREGLANTLCNAFAQQRLYAKGGGSFRRPLAHNAVMLDY